jgi:hypothetical protein
MTSTVAAPTKLLSLEEIENLEDVQFVEVEVPEWKGTLRFGSLNAGDMIDFVESNDGPAKRTAGLRLIVKSLVDATGQRIGEDKLLQTLKKRDARVCNRLVEAILKLNGIDSKKTSEVSKNDLGGASSDGSPTVLH